MIIFTINYVFTYKDTDIDIDYQEYDNTDPND